MKTIGTYSKLYSSFFTQDAFELAPVILGKYIVRKFEDGTIFKTQITEVEVYYGEDDLACHASKGRTPRTEVMYHGGGCIYVYLIYGMYWLINIVTGPKDHPQALLIRGLKGIAGPGRVGKILKLDKSFYGEDLTKSKRLWIEVESEDADGSKIKYKKLKRVGITYAGKWANKLWRYKIDEQ